MYCKQEWCRETSVSISSESCPGIISFMVDLLYLSSVAAAAAAKSLQSCPTLCDPIDGSPPGSSVPGILQARTLEWVAISFSTPFCYIPI